ncbi:MAG: alpha/beta hydrolase [Myxococcaceae bacterium]|nr:alpha/beta hydrolase [Myxococcaceae bacterium]
MNHPSHYPFASESKKARYLAHLQQRAAAWPIPFEGRTVETARGRTFMRISGPADAPPLVLLPGGGTSSLMWQPNIGGLSAHYRTYALDSIVDLGLSANTHPVKTVDDLTTWLEELFEALRLGPGLRLMGLSHGAWLAAHYAYRFPSRLAKVVLLAPPGWAVAIRPGYLLRMMQILLPPRRVFIRKVYRESLPGLVATGASGLKLIDEMTDDLALAFECFGLRRMTQMLEPTVAEDERLRLTMPTLFVIGEHEVMYPAQEALDRLARVAPGIQRLLIPGVGHDLTWARPDELNRHVLAFLDAT